MAGMGRYGWSGALGNGRGLGLPVDLWGKFAGATHILMQRSILSHLHDVFIAR